MLFSILAPILALALAPFTMAGPIAKRQSFGGRATFYDVGLGACGGTNVASDFIVALNAPQYGSGYPGPNCGRTITISYGGKSTQATIADLCPGCGYGDLDMSRGLFNYFASEDVGVFQMQWSFTDGNNGGGGGNQGQAEPAPQPQPQPQPSPSPSPEPTSTWTPAPTSEAAAAVVPSSTSETPEPESSSSTPTSSTSSASASASVAPLAIDSTPPAALGNLVLLNQIVTNYGSVIVAAAESQ